MRFYAQKFCVVPPFRCSRVPIANMFGEVNYRRRRRMRRIVRA